MMIKKEQRQEAKDEKTGVEGGEEKLYNTKNNK
jgi:hypothetical protein